jgi:hypothetical protein
MRADPKGRPYAAQYDQSGSRRRNDPSFKRRCIKLFGEDGLNRKVQEAFQRGHSSVDAWMMGKDIPMEVIFIIELLENSLPTQWPNRWQSVIDDEQKARILKDTGMTATSIADCMGITPYAVSKLLTA